LGGGSPVAAIPRAPRLRCWAQTTSNSLKILRSIARHPASGRGVVLLRRHGKARVDHLVNSASGHEIFVGQGFATSDT
jgi:hypothetical protein